MILDTEQMWADASCSQRQMTADVMSGHKDVVRASRADEQGRNKRSRDRQGQNEWSRADEWGGSESAFTLHQWHLDCLHARDSATEEAQGGLLAVQWRVKGKTGRPTNCFKTFMPARPRRLFSSRVYVFETENSTYIYSILWIVNLCVFSFISWYDFIRAKSLSSQNIKGGISRLLRTRRCICCANFLYILIFCSLRPRGMCINTTENRALRLWRALRVPWSIRIHLGIHTHQSTVVWCDSVLCVFLFVSRRDF